MKKEKDTQKAPEADVVVKIEGQGSSQRFLIRRGDQGPLLSFSPAELESS